MHNRLSGFLEKNNIIYSIQFVFRENDFTTHALIHLTNLISESFDNEEFLCEIFVDLQKAFDTVDHEILLSKLDHYGIRGIANKWFETCLCNRMQYVSNDGFKSNTSTLVFHRVLYLDRYSS